MFFKKIRERKGTTLVEMMIAFTVFGILIAITVSNFRQSLELQQLSTVLLESHDGASLLFEQMSREIRTSENLIVQNNGRLVNFDHQDGYNVSYEYRPDEKAIYRLPEGEQPAPVTVVGNSKMSIEGFSAEMLNDGQPYRRIVISVQVRVLDKNNTPYDTTIQTSVSPRFYE